MKWYAPVPESTDSNVKVVKVKVVAENETQISIQGLNDKSLLKVVHASRIHDDKSAAQQQVVESCMRRSAAWSELAASCMTDYANS